MVCPARSLDGFRVPSDWTKPLADGRLLLLSCFPSGPHRPTADTAHRRNEFVAALATQVLVLHATPGGRLEHLVRDLKKNRQSVPKGADLPGDLLSEATPMPEGEKQPASALLDGGWESRL